MPDTIQLPRPPLTDCFRFCPRCGQAEPDIRHERYLLCGQCGFLFYFNSAAAAGAFIFHEGKLILCVRARNPGQGRLDVPGGFVEFGETVEQGLRREIAEELHLEVRELRYLTSAPNEYLYAGVLYRTCDLFFVAEVASIAGLSAADDVEAVVMKRPEEVDETEFAFASTRRAFRLIRTV